MTNEAAERLQRTFEHNDKGRHQTIWLDDALAAERRDTVERIRNRLRSKDPASYGFDIWAILDEEAAR